jgi:hypothetical protein
MTSGQQYSILRYFDINQLQILLQPLVEELFLLSLKWENTHATKSVMDVPLNLFCKIYSFLKVTFSQV